MSIWQGDAALVNREGGRTVHGSLLTNSPSKFHFFPLCDLQLHESLEGMSFFFFFRDINTHSFPHLHWEPTVCGKEDRTTLWHAWVHVNATSKTPGQSSSALASGSFLPTASTWELYGLFQYPGTLILQASLVIHSVWRRQHALLTHKHPGIHLNRSLPPQREWGRYCAV